MPGKTMIAAAAGVLLAFAGEAFALEEKPSCNPNAGKPNARIECLTKMVNALRDRVGGLQDELAKKNETPSDQSAYLRRSDLESALGDYVKYKTPLAINLTGEPATSQQDGRCLEAYPGQVGVVARKPCDYEAKPELRWQLFPVLGTSAASR